MVTQGPDNPQRNGQVEKLVGKIALMNRPQLIHLLRGLECDFKLDFTDEFLQAISLERLRHILLGAVLHAHNVVSCELV